MDKESENFQTLAGNFVPLNGLPSHHLNEIINQSEVATYKKRQVVFKQGDRDNFSYYLLEGDLDLLADDQLVKQISGGTDAARYAMAQLQPRQMAAKAKTAVTVLKVDRNVLDRLLTMDNSDGMGEVQVADIDSEESVDWMTRLLQSELFARIPPANIQRIFTTLESVSVNAGDTIVEQGTPVTTTTSFKEVIVRSHARLLRVANLSSWLSCMRVTVLVRKRWYRIRSVVRR